MKQLIRATFLIWVLASCSGAAQPTPAAVSTLEALPSAMPTETLEALPSALPTLEPTASAMPEAGGMLNPQGPPLQEWRGIPIMPQATAGQEFSEGSAYSFRATATAEDVREFYSEQLGGLGWAQPFDNPFGEEGGLLVFRKEGSSLAITVTADEGSVVVLLALTLA